MSIRKGKTIIAGNAVSSDWTGTLEEYNIALKNGTIKENWVCYITDDEQGYISSKYGSDIALLDIIVSNQLLEGKDLIGKVLQGSMVLGSEYPDAYNKLLTNKNKSASTQVTETINGIELTYTQCVVGYKILDISNKNKYDQLFEATGTANFFVLDETNKLFYLPKTNNFLQPNTSVGEIGDYNEAGLPNITGSFVSRSVENGSLLFGGSETQAIQVEKQSATSVGVVNITGGTQLAGDRIVFDASKSNTTYGNSPTVQPQSTNVFIYYKVGNTIQTDASIDLEAQVLNLQQRNNIPFSLLESKYSETPLNNTSWLLSNGQWNDGTVYEAVYDRLINLQENTQEGISVKLHTDSYTDYDFVLNLEDETFRLPLLDGSESLPSDNFTSFNQTSLTTDGYTFIAEYNGYLVFTGYNGTGSTNLIVDVNNQRKWFQGGINTENAIRPCCNLFILKGDIVTAKAESQTIANINYFGIYKAQGNGSLYFYVGETNTDINIINTGKLAEKYSKDIDNKLDKSQITNCLLEVPQTVKLELANDVLTIKAGTIITVPYGTTNLSSTYPVGSQFLNSSFKVIDTQYSNSQFFVCAELQSDITRTFTGTGNYGLYIGFLSSNNSLIITFTQKAYSGTVDPATTYCSWYNTSENKVRGYTTSYDRILSFPLGKITISDGTVTSIDKVFNGFGYIGSTIWVDKGVKGLIPNGRNEDGSLNNIEFTTSNVTTINMLGSSPTIISVNTNGALTSSLYYTEQEEQPTGGQTLWYKPSENIMSRINANGTLAKPFNTFIIATNDCTNGVISNFQPKLPFRAVDSNDFNKTPHIIDAYINGESWYRVYSDGWCEQGGRGWDPIFLKTFKDTNYTIMAIGYVYVYAVAINTKSTTGCTFHQWQTGDSAGNTTPVTWYACGYIN